MSDKPADILYPGKISKIREDRETKIIKMLYDARGYYIKKHKTNDKDVCIKIEPLYYLMSHDLFKIKVYSKLLSKILHTSTAVC